MCYASWLLQEWDASYDGVDLLKKALTEANSEEPVGQGRCTGFSGNIKAIKVKTSCGEAECEHKEDKKLASKIERRGIDFVKLEREFAHHLTPSKQKSPSALQCEAVQMTAWRVMQSASKCCKSSKLLKLSSTRVHALHSRA
jgi:hypothetical protein